jgi:hypothetical protein
MTAFGIEVHQNEYLPVGAAQVDAVLRVTAADGGTDRTEAEAAEVIIVDVSGSMGHPRSKIGCARDATAAAITCIRDGVRFAVIAGDSRANEIFPGGGELAVASDQSRSDSAHALGRLRPGGGTGIANWLHRADELLSSHPRAIKHAILLTDGRDSSPADTRTVLAAIEGSFQCDCRGIGTDWDVDQLRAIASALLGDVALVRRPEELVEDFTDLMQRAMAKQTTDVGLRVWTPLGASVEFLKQVAPTIEDLTPRRVESGERVGEYPTGSWGDEARDYHLRIQVPPREIGEEMLAARVSATVDDHVVGEGKVLAVWTADRALSTRLNPHVVRSTGQSDYAEAVHDGIAALREGNEVVATTQLGRAAQLARALGDDDKLEEVARVVQIDDAERGTVHLKRRFEELDVMELDTNSTRTARTRAPRA